MDPRCENNKKDLQLQHDYSVKCYEYIKACMQKRETFEKYAWCFLLGDECHTGCRYAANAAGCSGVCEGGEGVFWGGGRFKNPLLVSDQPQRK